MGFFSKVFSGNPFKNKDTQKVLGGTLLGGANPTALAASLGTGDIIDRLTNKKNKSEDNIGGTVGETGTGAVTEEEAQETTKSRLFRLGLFFTSPLGLGAAGKSSRARLT
jgi:hypothetical protein